MKEWSLLIWLPQFGISVVFPLIGFVMLAVWLREQGFEATSCATAEEGVDRVLSMAGPDDVICSWGSLYAVGLIRHHLGLC